MFSESDDKEKRKQLKQQAEVAKKELSRLRKLKKPLYIPIVRMNGGIADGSECAGRIECHGGFDRVAAKQIINESELLGTYAEYGYDGKFNPIKTGDGLFWLTGLDSTKNVRLARDNADTHEFGKPTYVQVDGLKDYSSVGGNNRVPVVTIIDLSEIIKNAGVLE